MIVGASRATALKDLASFLAVHDGPLYVAFRHTESMYVTGAAAYSQISFKSRSTSYGFGVALDYVKPQYLKWHEGVHKKNCFPHN